MIDPVSVDCDANSAGQCLVFYPQSLAIPSNIFHTHNTITVSPSHTLICITSLFLLDPKSHGG